MIAGLYKKLPYDFGDKDASCFPHIGNLLASQANDVGRPAFKSP